MPELSIIIPTFNRREILLKTLDGYIRQNARAEILEILVIDDGSNPPRAQVELFPVPDGAYGIPFNYIAEQAALNSTSVTLLPWLRPSALIEGVSASIKRHNQDFNGADRAEARFAELVAEMVNKESRALGSVPLQMAARYTRYRSRRVARSVPLTPGV